MWPTVCNFTKKEASSQIFSRTLLKLSKRLLRRAGPSRLLLLLDKNSRYYERCIKQTPPGRFFILINDSDLREIGSHKISNRIRAKTCTPSDFLLHFAGNAKIFAIACIVALFFSFPSVFFYGLTKVVCVFFFVTNIGLNNIICRVLSSHVLWTGINSNHGFKEQDAEFCFSTNKNILSPLPQCLWQSNMAGYWLLWGFHQ